MSVLNRTEAKHLSSLYSRRQFNFKEIKLLHKLFVNFAENTTSNLRNTLHDWRDIVVNQRENPWFKKAAHLLALNSTINIQKSLWRMK